ncbi:MAG: valine--tRNA ligase [Bacteroidales bacterium]|nr:valine--tRNA ligase [Bacteroidales bacterium]MBS3774024.1 valine--tRNA ligase [Bacteroidales bacterium]
MDIAKKYDPSKVEQKWYQYWMDKEFFHSEPDEREPYTIVIPPPNVTGVLHMGHILNNTIQDILIRRARMLGKNACWVPGTDHASIATEAKVVAKLKKEGIDKYSLTREEFLKHAWEWKEKHGGIILEQLKKLGASCDWNRTKFTMDDDMYESVIKVFIDLYEKGYVYRGVRMVNWDPEAKTAISDEEVDYKEVQSKLYYIKYPVDGTDEFIEIATTRPETILGDTAVCVNPGDTRYTHLQGKEVIVPVINRKVPLIVDDYVDMEFGSGALKITPAHDENDYEIGLRHNLKTIDIFNDDGTLNENAEIHIGEDRFEARDNFVRDLENEGYLIKEEDYTNSIGFSERTDAVIEPKLSTQWFCRMKEMAKPALENVINDNIRFHPSKFKNIYKHWMENIKDWCISRQLWWGQRIPAYYLPDGNYVVAENETEALKKAKEKTDNYELTVNDLKQDPDVLDTWFSSWLWPISVFDGIRNPDNEDINYYYPTDDLVTAPEILFFWVARMIMAGYEYRGKKPFGNVYLTGVVRDNQRRKMSKSLGNSPDPLRLINQYGADGVRVGMLLCSPAGNDLLFDESLTEQGRNFGNKIWNAFRLVKNWNVDENIDQPAHSAEAIDWFRNRLNKAIGELDEQYAKFRLSDALMNLYRLFWDEFSSWYLEIVKPGYQQPVDKKTFEATLSFFEQLMVLLHPIMPFITEEIWQLIYDRGSDESIMVTEVPRKGPSDAELLTSFEKVKELITSVRNIRKDKEIPNKEALSLKVNGEHMAKYDPIVRKMANIDHIEGISGKPDNAVSFMVGTTEYYIPVENLLDKEEEIKKLEEELEYTRGFLQSVLKKLDNEQFVRNAPEKVIDRERKKKEDAEQKIKTLEERISSLKG